MLSHLALALAGLCLTAAEWYHVPEMVPGVAVYLGLVGLSWRLGRRFVRPSWVVNLLGVAIAAAVVGWFCLRTPAPPGASAAAVASAAGDAFLDGAFIPYLGPMLMALLLVRLFRPV